MCGIAAFIAKENIDTKDVLPYIKLVSIKQDSRGRDNAGVAFTNTKGNLSILRGADKFDNHLNQDDSSLANLLFNRYEELQDNVASEGLVWLAHSRRASVGKTTLNNTHPFTFPNTGLIGVHNGTIKNIDKMAEYLKVDVKECDTDSQAVFKMINEKSPEEVFPLYDNSLNKGGAFVWTYAGENHLYVYVGKSVGGTQERPLHYLTTNLGVFISSEKDSLEILALMLLGNHCSLEEMSISQFKTEQILCVTASDIETVGSPIVKNIQYAPTSYDNYSGNSKYSSYGTSQSSNKSSTIQVKQNNLSSFRKDQVELLKAPFIHNGRYAYRDRYLCNSFLEEGERYVMVELPDYISLSKSGNKIKKHTSSYPDTWSIVIRDANNKYRKIGSNSMFSEPKRKLKEVNFYRGVLLEEHSEWKAFYNHAGFVSYDLIRKYSLSPYPTMIILNQSLKLGSEHAIVMFVGPKNQVLKGDYIYPFSNFGGHFQNGLSYLTTRKQDKCSC